MSAEQTLVHAHNFLATILHITSLYVRNHVVRCSKNSLVEHDNIVETDLSAHAPNVNGFPYNGLQIARPST